MLPELTPAVERAVAAARELAGAADVRPLHLLQPTEQIDTARVLDAAANRAREALRVAEDYCRFVLDDVLLDRELKTLRHELAMALSVIPAGRLLEARETQRDVGTLVTTPS